MVIFIKLEATFILSLAALSLPIQLMVTLIQFAIFIQLMVTILKLVRVPTQIMVFFGGRADKMSWEIK